MTYAVSAHGFMAFKHATYQFPVGLTLVEGGNGHGKSALLEAAAWAFWGKTLRGTNPWNEAVPAADRYLTVQMLGTEVHLPALQVFQAGRSDPGFFQQYATGRQMYAALASEVGGYDEWRLSHVLSSRDVANFSGASPSQRMALLSTVLRMGVLEKAAESAKLAVAAIREKIRVLLQKREVLSSRIAANRSALAATDAVGASYDEEAPSPPAEALSLADTYRERALALRRQQEALVRVQSAPVDAGTPRCVTCGAFLGSAFRPEPSEVLQKSIALSDEMNALVAQARRIESAWQAHDRAVSQQADNLRRAAEVALRMAATRRQLEDDNEALVDGAVMEVAQQQRLRLEEAAHTALSRDIPYDMLEEGFSAFTRIANGYLERIAGEKIRVRIAGTRDLASGRVKQEASLVIEGLGGPRGQYESASSGEQRRVDLALLLAVGDLAREYAGTAQGPLFLDEALDSLDVNGRAAVVEVLADLARDRPILLISHETLPVRFVQHLAL